MVTAQPAEATVSGCIDRLSRADSSPGFASISVTNKAVLTAATGFTSRSHCAGMSVAIGISRPDLRDFRARNASRYVWEADVEGFYADFRLRPHEVGEWMVRQIAVKDRSGKLEVRQFTRATTPQRTVVKYRSVLTGRPIGTVRPARVVISGTLKTWNGQGRLVNLQNQVVLLQVKRPRTADYVTIGAATTSRTGSYRVAMDLRAHRGEYVRVAFISPVGLIASDYTFLGRVR
jgi:hypothetical protein